ncbi:MAG: DUF5067 domain-containing protein [Alphaproteobacteria bacterium]|nr:DUF5067 domain-containing protein [Alphaproteobacteria bacterium]
MEEKKLEPTEEQTQLASEPQDGANSQQTDSAEEQAPVKKPFRKIRFLFNFACLAAVVFAVVLFIKWPKEFAGRTLWENEIQSFTKKSVYDDLVYEGLPAEITVSPQTARVEDLDYTADALKWKEFKQFTQSEFIFSLIINDLQEGKKVYRYTYVENWDIYLDKEKIATVETTTMAVAQPKMRDNYPFYRYVTNTVYPSNFEELVADYQRQANQEDLASRVSIGEAWLEPSTSVWRDDTLFVLEYTWTNQSQDYDAPIYDVDVRAYQDGVELNEDYYYNSQYGIMDKIEPGKTVTITQAYYLSNEVSPVTVRATNYWSVYEDYPAELTETFTLN